MGAVVGADTGHATDIGTVRAGRTGLEALVVAGCNSPNGRVETAAEVLQDAVEPEFAADGGRLGEVAAGASGVSLESAAGAGMALRTAVLTGVGGKDS